MLQRRDLSCIRGGEKEKEEEDEEGNTKHSVVVDVDENGTRYFTCGF